MKSRARKSKIAITLFASFCTLMVGCNSLVYSPSLNLPTSTLEEGQFDLQGGAEMMPETRPNASPDTSAPANLYSVGFHGQVSYALTNELNLSAKSWIAIEDSGAEDGIGDVRSGVAFSAQYIIPQGDGGKILVMPKVGVLLNYSSFAGLEDEGYGAGISTVYHKQFSPEFSLYGGAGLIIGTHSFYYSLSGSYGNNIQMGFGIIGHSGLAWDIYDRLRINAEINPIYQVNAFESEEHFLVSPSIGIGYTF